MENADIETEIAHALQPHRQTLENHPHVQGLGLGSSETGEYAVIIFVEEITQEIRDKLTTLIPSTITLQLADGRQIILPIELKGEGRATIQEAESFAA